MPKMNLKGVGVALITPFKDDESVNYDALSNIVESQIKNGTDYLVVLGTTAETPTLSESEKKQILACVVNKNAGRKPIVLGIGGNNTRATVDQLQTTNLNGVDAILSVVPYYNKPSQEGIYQHFKAISEASPLPIIVYNVPSRTGVNMSAETTLRLANEYPNIIATKEASGNLEQIGAIIKHKPEYFEVLSGDDGLTFDLIKLGACGVISVIGNAFPKEFCLMVKSALEGKYDEAQSINNTLADIYHLLFVEGNPAGVKCMLQEMGMIDNKLRLPLVPVSSETRKKIKEAILSHR